MTRALVSLTTAFIFLFTSSWSFAAQGDRTVYDSPQIYLIAKLNLWSDALRFVSATMPDEDVAFLRKKMSELGIHESDKTGLHVNGNRIYFNNDLVKIENESIRFRDKQIKFDNKKGIEANYQDVVHLLKTEGKSAGFNLFPTANASLLDVAEFSVIVLVLVGLAVGAFYLTPAMIGGALYSCVTALHFCGILVGASLISLGMITSSLAAVECKDNSIVVHHPDGSTDQVAIADPPPGERMVKLNQRQLKTAVATIEKSPSCRGMLKQAGGEASSVTKGSTTP